MVNSINTNLKEIKESSEARLIGNMKGPTGKIYEVRALFQNQEGKYFTFDDSNLDQTTVNTIIELSKGSIESTKAKELSEEICLSKDGVSIKKSNYQNTQIQDNWKQIDKLARGLIQEENLFDFENEKEEEPLKNNKRKNNELPLKIVLNEVTVGNTQEKKMNDLYKQLETINEKYLGIGQEKIDQFRDSLSQKERTEFDSSLSTLEIWRKIAMLEENLNRHERNLKTDFEKEIGREPNEYDYAIKYYQEAIQVYEKYLKNIRQWETSAKLSK